jgi:hypothetical protein
MMTGARGRHAEDTKWLRKFEAQWGRQERLEAQALPRADRQRACTRGTRTAPEEEAVRQGWGRGQVVGGFSFVRRVHLLTANYVRNGYARTAVSTDGETMHLLFAYY